MTARPAVPVGQPRGFSARIRAAIAASPDGLTLQGIAEALGENRAKATTNTCSMVIQGLLTRVGEGTERRYTIGRAPARLWGVCKPRARAKPKPRQIPARRVQAERVRAAAIARHTPTGSGGPRALGAIGEAESIAQFLKRGGRVEVLPGCRYVAPTVLPVGFKS